MTFEEAKAYAAAHVGIRPNYPGRLSGKIAIVTGGAQGFGFGIAQELISEGAQVVIANRGEKAGLAAVEKLGDHSAFAQCDVSVPESCRNLMIKAVEIFGGIDIFISNAGVLKAGALPNMTPEDFQAVTNIDYNGYFFCTKYVSEIMKAEYEADKSRFYDIIQINSKSGLVGSKANFAYAGAKFGGIGLTQSFALELVDWNIKVNSVCPAVERSGKGTFCAVSCRRQGSGRKNGGGCQGVLSCKIPDSSRLHPEGRLQGNILLRRAGVRDRAGHSRDGRTDNAELICGILSE